MAFLTYQVGSLSKRILQLEGDRYADGLSKEEIKKHIADEIADIMAEILFIAHELGIDVSEAWEKMIESDKGKISKRS